MVQTSATNEKQIKLANAQKRRDIDTEGEIIKALMANTQGRRWLWNQIAICRVFLSDENTEYGRMAYDKGLRAYGLQLFAAIGLHAARFVPVMMEENSSTIKKDQDDGGSLDDDGAGSDA